MTEGDLQFFKGWFSEFCGTFCFEDKKEQKNLTLKEDHTRNVCENIVALARGEALSADDVLIAETIGLFHDVGRFPQYAQYKTFRDGASVNHGLLGANTLIGKKVLDRLSASERDIIIDAVKFHNAFSIADISDARKILFLKLIRDADKLDIWRVFLDLYENTDEEKPESVVLGLPDLPSYSAEILPLIGNGEIVSLSMLKTLTDFKLLQLSWIYDLNFRTSFRLLTERNYISLIAGTLPQTAEILNAVSCLQAYAKERLR